MRGARVRGRGTTLSSVAHMPTRAVHDEPVGGPTSFEAHVGELITRENVAVLVRRGIVWYQPRRSTTRNADERVDDSGWDPATNGQGGHERQDEQSS